MGGTLADSFKEMKTWRDNFYNWSPKNLNVDKKLFKSSIKSFIKKFFNKLGFSVSRNQNNNLDEDLCCFAEDDPNRWVINGLLKKK